MTAIAESIQRRRDVSSKSLVIILIVAAVGIGVYVWALLRNLSQFITPFGLASVVALLFLPIVTAYLTARTTIREMKSPTSPYSLKDYTELGLRRWHVLLTLDAVISIPVVVLYYVYLLLYVDALFSSLIVCTYDGPCNATAQFTLPPDLGQQSILALIFAVGLWGVNILAVVLASGLVTRGHGMARATAETIVLLVLTVIAMIVLMLWAYSRQPILVAVAALLPYVFALPLLLSRSGRQQAMAEVQQ